MSQNEFYTAVVDGILDYFPEDYQDAKVLIAEQTKSGDVKVHGLSITKKENTISPVLNLDSFYDSYLRGEDMNHIMRTIAATYVQAIRKQPDIDIPDFSKEGLEKNVLIRAIDRNANENFLKELAKAGYKGYVNFEDFSTVESNYDKLVHNIAYMKGLEEKLGL